MKHLIKLLSALWMLLLLTFNPAFAQTNKLDLSSTSGKACYDANSALDGCYSFTSPLKLGGSFDQKTDVLTISTFSLDPILLDNGNVKIVMAMNSTGTGTFDWDTGKSTAKLSLTATVSSPTGKYNLGKSCKIPATLNLTTETSGSLTGQRYPAKALSGELKYVDNTFVIQDPVSGSDCGLYTSLIGGVTPTKSGAMSIWFKMTGIVTPPPAGTLVTEVETNNSPSQANLFSNQTQLLEGSTNISDPDYFAVTLNSGQTVSLEYVITQTTKTTYSCNPDSDTAPKTSTFYSAVALSIGGASNYTQTTATTKGSCPPTYKEGTNINATDTTTVTYTLKKSWTASSNNQTLNLPVQGANLAGFPTSGAYSIKVSVK